MTRVRIGVNDSGWGGPPARAGFDAEGAYSTERFLDEAAAAGYEGVELFPGMLAGFANDPAALRDALDRRGLTASGTVIVGRLEDPDAWESLERQTRDAERALSPFDARHLALIDALHFDGNPPPLAEREWRQLIVTTHRLGRLASDLGLTLAVHQHADTHLETAAQIERFLADTDPSLVSLCADTGHLAWCGIDPQQFLTCYHERIDYVHLKNVGNVVLTQHHAKRLPWVLAVRHGVVPTLDDGVVDIPECLAALDDCGYDGWAIVETERLPTPGDEPLRAAREALAFLRASGIDGDTTWTRTSQGGAQRAQETPAGRRRQPDTRQRHDDCRARNAVL